MLQTIDVVHIKNITIKIGGKEVTITMDEAKQLKDAMDCIFPAEVAPVQIHYHNEPYYVPTHQYPPYWTFGEYVTTSGGSSTCNASLDIKPEGNIIL